MKALGALAEHVRVGPWGCRVPGTASPSHLLPCVPCPCACHPHVPFAVLARATKLQALWSPWGLESRL